MNETIKTKAQELYPIESKAECHVAFLQGARMVEKAIKLGIADILEHGSIEERLNICSALIVLEKATEKYKKRME